MGKGLLSRIAIVIIFISLLSVGLIGALLVRVDYTPPSILSPAPGSDAASLDIARKLDINNRIVLFTYAVTAACEPYTLNDGNAYYCNLDDTIYMGSWFKTQPYVVQVFAYAHEDGHSEDPNFLLNSTFNAEQFADHYAGRKIRYLYNRGDLTRNDISILRNWIAVLPLSDHGTGQQRLIAFDRGFNLN